MRAIGGRAHPDHLRVLVTTVRDCWSDAEPQHEEPSSYPIAREAVAALHAYGTVADVHGDELVDFAASRTASGPWRRTQLWDGHASTPSTP